MRAMRARTLGLAVAWLLVGAAGCQCLEPVSDVPDAGRRPDGGGGGAGGGAGGGSGGGGGSADGGCSRAAQCGAGPRPTVGWCGSGPDAGYSCIEDACVWECPMGGPGRSCSVNQASYCLECGDAGTACPLTANCGAPTTSGSASVEPGGSCTTWPGTSAPLTAVTLMRTASAQCRFMVGAPDGGAGLGELWKLDDGEYVAYFPGLGGWCTGRPAFTGAPRAIFTCPACQFVLLGFE